MRPRQLVARVLRGLAGAARRFAGGDSAGRPDAPAEILREARGARREAKRAGVRLKDLERRVRRVEYGLAESLRLLGKGPGGAAEIEIIRRDVQAVLRRLAIESGALPYPWQLTAERFGIWSQNEEDGLTLAILTRIGAATQRFVEIGCGTNGGNSGILAAECGWSGLMVDASDEAVDAAQALFANERVRVVKAWVTRENVNQILREHGAEGEIDLLSIDIDGNDYWVWEALAACSPRMVIVEYNSAFGPRRAVAVPYDPWFDRHRIDKQYYGASLAALAHLGKRKGYRLLAVEPRGVNAYFLRQDVAPTIPACEVSDAYRLLDTYLEARRRGAADIYDLVQRAGLPLVEVAPPADK